jgi:hypothetical protein
MRYRGARGTRVDGDVNGSAYGRMTRRMSDFEGGAAYERIRVLVETTERAFRGYLYKPVKEGGYRLSDHLNDYEHSFIKLADVQVLDRGQQYRAGEKRDFVAVSVASITYITPLRDNE